MMSDANNAGGFVSTETSAATQLSFEAALEQLEAIVADLEDGSIGLEASLIRFEEGIGLLRNCHTLLETAERRIEVLTGFDADGQAQTAPFDASATFDEPGAASLKPARRRASSKSTPAANRDDAEDGGGQAERRLF